MSSHRSIIGRQLSATLPEVYRTRDQGDQAAYLESAGELLDLIRNTIEQRLADSFPDLPEDGRAAQGWLLPYFAQLLDATLLSPHLVGRREEVTHAVGWRQRKGTVGVIERLAEAVGRLEVEVQEGWRRVVVTPRLARQYRSGSAAVTGTDLPPATVDLRVAARAVTADPIDPEARRTRFAGEYHHWKQAHPEGTPCFPGSFEDPSRRTLDLRTPTWKEGHAHPRRIVLYAPPPTGFFPPGRITLQWGERFDPAHVEHFASEPLGDGVRLFNPSLEPSSSEPRSVVFTTSPPAFSGDVTIHGLNFLGSLVLDNGRLELEGVAASRVEVRTVNTEAPVLTARNCLFESVEAEDGLVRLEYCTVGESLRAARLQASDCIFAGDVELLGAGSCIRFSRLPAALGALPESVLLVNDSTTATPRFFEFPVCGPEGTLLGSSEFGQPGHAVLHPATPDSICFGAEDGGEMGAYHNRFYSLQVAAVLDKLEDYLPVGLEAVLIPDARLLAAAPEIE